MGRTEAAIKRISCNPTESLVKPRYSLSTSSSLSLSSPLFELVSVCSPVRLVRLALLLFAASFACNLCAHARDNKNSSSSGSQPFCCLQALLFPAEEFGSAPINSTFRAAAAAQEQLSTKNHLKLSTTNRIAILTQHLLVSCP